MWLFDMSIVILKVIQCPRTRHSLLQNSVTKSSFNVFTVESMKTIIVSTKRIIIVKNIKNYYNKTKRSKKEKKGDVVSYQLMP